jgi:hypothetical protein
VHFGHLLNQIKAFGASNFVPLVNQLFFYLVHAVELNSADSLVNQSPKMLNRASPLPQPDFQ